jgi:hypothetical protein
MNKNIFLTITLLGLSCVNALGSDQSKQTKDNKEPGKVSISTASTAATTVALASATQEPVSKEKNDTEDPDFKELKELYARCNGFFQWHGRTFFSTIQDSPHLLKALKTPPASAYFKNNRPHRILENGWYASLTK